MDLLAKDDINVLQSLFLFINLFNDRSYIGMIIYSTKLDTSTKVIAQYGGTTWISHSGYVLRGATSGVTANNNAKDGGNDSVSYTPSGSIGSTKLTQNQLPAHTHATIGPGNTNARASYTGVTESYTGVWYGGKHESSAGVYWSSSIGANEGHNHTWTGTTGTINTLPNYKSVYIWERTA